MGSFLSQPNTQKSHEYQFSGYLSCYTTAMQGWRLQMEDAHLMKPNFIENISLFAVFDGHGGSGISKFLADNFMNVLISQPAFEKMDFMQSLHDTFLQLDDMIKNNEIKNTFIGSTAVVALIVEKMLYVANLGDSRCLLMRDDETIELTKDHLPSNELARIRYAGGFVDEQGRLNGTLSVSRAFGDFEFKQEPLPANQQMVIAEPEIRKIKLNKDDRFLFLGCDGVFETQNSYKVMEFISARVAEKQEPSIVLEQLLDTSLAADTSTGYGCDNMTAMLILLNQ
ncbi:unnamed protein product [Paramecium primaurelia]|uniref:protein-serine/threonine phosphatase n=2 Tax=Paramecium TaxID=5884 RepID=A0A8S1UTV1_9CILI|nr:unnamed protein product [Paramecium primaurelia]CAD8167009.1 unnamed protein product [Paramecium pentaurelia]